MATTLKKATTTITKVPVKKASTLPKGTTIVQISKAMSFAKKNKLDFSYLK